MTTEKNETGTAWKGVDTDTLRTLVDGLRREAAHGFHTSAFDRIARTNACNEQRGVNTALAEAEAELARRDATDEGSTR
jgi:hypothetical protein